MHITVSQHIYSNVPKEKSPKKRRGYQTLFYSIDDLSKDDVFILEERAQYYSGDSEPTKYQFHMLGDKAVATQICALAELDEFGRKGRFLAHSLIVSPKSFRDISYCPLGLFSPTWFVRDLENAFSHGDMKTGNLPSISINVADAWKETAIHAAQEWSPQNLEKLARLGWQARDLLNNRKAIVMKGDIKSIFQTLALLFLLNHPNKRQFLTFDTHVLGCDWGKDWPFWAWSGVEDSSKKFEYFADADAKNVLGDLDDHKDTPYERWLVQFAIPMRLNNIQASNEHALRLQSALMGKNFDFDRINPQVGNEFARVNIEVIEDKVLSYFPESMKGETNKEIRKIVRTDPWLYMQRLGTGISRQEATNMVSNLQLAHLLDPLDSSENRVLLAYAREQKSEELLSLLFLRTGDLSNWQKCLSRLSAPSYSKIVNRAVSSNAIMISDAFCIEHQNEWLKIAKTRLRPGEITRALKQVDRKDDNFDADQLIILLPNLHPNDQEALTNWLKKYKGDAPRLRAALNVPEPAALSFLNNLKNLLPGSNRKSEGNKK